jgi:hypothetical protein
MDRTKQRLHRAACFSFMLLALFLIKTNIGFCAAPTLEWTGAEGLWNDGVTPDYGTTSDSFTFKVIYTDSDNDAPYTGYPKVHILKDGTEIDSYAMTKIGTGTDYDGTGEQYTYSTNFSLAGNDYTYYFKAKDSNEDIAGFSSPTNEHTLTVVSGYVWVDYDTGSDTTGDGSQGNPYQTIAYGISQASSGQAVRVLPRTSSPYEYVETFSMVSGVHLVSDNGNSGDSETTYNDPYSTYSTSMLTRTGRTIIKGKITFPSTITDNVVVDGFTVYRGAGDKPMMDILGKSPIIRNNIVYRAARDSYNSFCIQMKGGSGDTSEPIIENNLLHGVKEAGIGISMYQYPIIQDNLIWDATEDACIGINRKGTASPEGTTITIRNNEIFNCGGAGIGTGGDTAKLVTSLKVIILGNIIHDNGYDMSGESYASRGAGIGLERCCSTGEILGVTIGGLDPGQGNQIYNNRLAGIRLDGNSDTQSLRPVLIQNNDIYNNGKTGIILIDIGYNKAIGPGGESVERAQILDNTIYGHTSAGINIGGLTYADIMYNLIHDNATAGIAFNMGDVEGDPDPPSSYITGFEDTITIEDNDIYSNTMAGIAVKDAITGDVTIAGNDIHDNIRGGISIINSCNLVINRNEIHENYRAGIRTGGFVDDDYFANSNTECEAAGEPYPCCTDADQGTCNSSVGFIGPVPDPGVPEGAFLDVSQNKVYGNGTSGYGAGINIRHASGTIYNNLIYENTRCGIRYGDYIDEIINNTVVNNGNDLFDGSGILYDSLDGYVDEWPPSGDGPSIPIRNNISALNTRTGIKTGTNVDEPGVCLSGDYRDYNLLYGNNGTSDHLPPFSGSYLMMQLCGCWPNDNEIFADPLFVDPDGVDNIAGNGDDDYRIQVTSPAADAGDEYYPLDYPNNDVSPFSVGTTAIDIGAYGGPLGIDL